MPALAWLLNLAYTVFLIAVSPLVLFRALVHGKYRDGWSEKLLGRLPERDSAKPCLWFHAVSVGEVLQLQSVLKELAAKVAGTLRVPSAAEYSDHEILITTTTSTGLAVAQSTFPQHRVCYFPLDFSWAVSNALSRVKPSAVILVELELWPNFILHAARAGIPVALINGRISEQSFRGYRRIRPMMKRLLRCFHTLAVQNETYADRLLALGAPAERIHVTGSIKFDHVATDRRNPRSNELRESFGVRERDQIFIAGSTQAPEEDLALQTYSALKPRFPHLRLILVPRHKERFEEVAQLVRRRGLPLLRRTAVKSPRDVAEIARIRAQRSHAGEPVGKASAPGGREAQGEGHVHSRYPHPLPLSQRERGVLPPLPLGEGRGEGSSSGEFADAGSDPVLLLDTLGELAACWGLADIAFVGGSLTNRGGQNMIEPAAYGAAVLFGPNTRNFRDVVEVLLSRNAARVVADGRELTAAVAELLALPEHAQQQGAVAQQLVLAQQGATAKTVDLIQKLMVLPSHIEHTPHRDAA